MSFDLSSLKQLLPAGLIDLCTKVWNRQEQQLRDQLAQQVIYTPQQVDHRVDEAKTQLLTSLKKFIEQNDWMKGWSLILNHCKNAAGGHTVHEWSDIPNRVKRLLNESYDPSIELQRHLNLSDTSMSLAYDAALKFHEARDYNNSLLILSCLNFLNPHFFETWFLQGVCHQQLNDWSQALYSFSMAALMDPEHALPYWHMALCYHEIPDKQQCQRFAEIARTMKLPEGVPDSFMQSIELTIQPSLH